MKRKGNNMFRRAAYAVVMKYRHSSLSHRVIFVLDVALFAIAFVITELLLRQPGASQTMSEVIAKFILSAVLTIGVFIISGTHRLVIRHAGVQDVSRIIIVSIVLCVLAMVIAFINTLFPTPVISPAKILSYRESLMLYMLLGTMMITCRLMLQRVYNDYFRRRRKQENVIIYGAGAAGQIALNALQQDNNTNYHVCAFLDDDSSKVGQYVNGIPIIKVRSGLNEQYVKSRNVSQAIIAIPSVRLPLKQAIVGRALDLGLQVKSVPHITMWLNGAFNSSQITDVKIEDLLERETIKLDNVNIVREVVDKVVLVTGAAGSIGSEICRQLMHYSPRKVVMVDQAESPMYELQFELNQKYADRKDNMTFIVASVTDKKRMEQLFAEEHPQLVYHAAAYKHVPFMEGTPYEAVSVNVFGTRVLADLSIKFGVQKFVMISTDKAVNPTNVMGASKRLAEIYIQSRSTETTHFVTTRFGNVLGSNGSVIPLFRKQLEEGGPLTITHRDITRYFMTIPEACNLVLEAGSMGKGGDIFVFDMGKPVKIYDLAKRMIQLSGHRDIEIKEIGLRPGEKLYEELLATKENTLPTYHPKIFIAQVRRYPLENIDREYDNLYQIVQTMDDMEIVKKMKAIVPEFVSNNSIYCKLDISTPPPQRKQSEEGVLFD